MENNSSAESTLSQAYDLLVRCKENLNIILASEEPPDYSDVKEIRDDIDKFLTAIDESEVMPNATGSVQPGSNTIPEVPSSGEASKKTLGQIAKEAMNAKWQTDEAWETVAQAVAGQAVNEYKAFWQPMYFTMVCKEIDALKDQLTAERELSEKLFKSLSAYPRIFGEHYTNELRDAALTAYNEARKNK